MSTNRNATTQHRRRKAGYRRTDNFKTYFRTWVGCTSATIYEFAALSYGVDPLRDAYQDIDGRQQALLDAVIHERLRCIGQRRTYAPLLPKDGPLHPVDQELDIEEATAFAVSKGWGIPSEMRAAFLKSAPSGDEATTKGKQSAHGEADETPALPKDGRITGKREGQIQILESTARALGYDPLDIPDGGRAAIRAHCLKHRLDLFTPDGFDHAWKAANRQVRIRIRGKERYLAR